MANGKIQIKDGAGNNLFPKVRTIDMTDSAGNVKLFDGEKIRPQFIPNAVDDIVPYAAVTSNAGVATVSQQADYHYINVTSKKIYATVHNGTSFVWDGGSALNTTTLYTSNGKSFRWDGTNLVEIVLPKAMASAINTNTNTNEFVPTVAATTAYFQPKGNYAAAGHNHNGTYVSKLVAGANITLSPATGTGGEITISATDTNTWAVSSVKGANGLTQNASTGNVIISGIDTKGDSSTKGVVITTSVITSNAGGNTSVVPTMNAIYTALAGKAATGHTHNYNNRITSVNAGANIIVTSAINGDTVTYTVSGTPDHITSVVSGNAGIKVTSTINGNTVTYQVSNTVTNTNLVSSVTGYNGLSANPTTGVVKVSGVDTKGDGTTRGIVITSNAIVSTTSTNAATGSQAALETSVIVPTMRAVYTALAGKANTNHTHNYASQDHVAIVSKGDNTTVNSSVNGTTTTYYVSGTPDHVAIVTSGNTGIAVTSAVNGNTTTYYVSNKITNTDHITSVVAGTNATVTSSVNGSTVTYAVSATDTNTWAVSSVKGANGLTQNASTGNVIISGIDTKGDGTTKGVVITSSGITSNAAGNTSLVPTMNAVYTALAGKADVNHNHGTDRNDIAIVKAGANTTVTSTIATANGNSTVTYYVSGTADHITSVVSGNAGIKVTSTIAGNTVTYQVSNTVANTNLVSSVTGYNGLSANPTTGVVKVSGVSTTGDGATIGVVVTSDAIVSTTSTNAATGSKNVGETKYIVPTMRAVWNMSNNINSRFGNAGVAVDGYFFSGLADCPAMRSKYRTTTWSDSVGSSGLYPGWLAPIKADGLTEVMNTFSLGRGYTISGAGGSSAFSIPTFGQFLSGCAVPTFMAFATTVSELSSSVSGKADSEHTHANYTSYTAAQLRTNHTHNYAAADHIAVISKGSNTTVTSSVNGNTTTYYVSATNTSYTAANLSTNHSHAINKIVGLQTALDSKAATGHTHSNYIRNQAAYAVDGYFFSGLSECSAMRSKYESTLWTHSGGSGTYPGWVAPITAAGITEITNLFNYCKGYASNASIDINVQSFFSACAVPTFMGFAQAVVELNNSLAGKQATIPANTYAPYTHTHTGYATSNTSYTAAQLSTNHSHVLANGNYGSGAVKTYSGVTSVATSGNTCVVPTMNAVYSELKMRPNILEGGTLEITSVLNFGAIGGTTAQAPATISNKLVASHNTLADGRMVWVSATLTENRQGAQGEFTEAIHAGFWYKAPITGWTWLPSTSALGRTIYCVKDSTEYRVKRFHPQFTSDYCLQASVMDIEITASASATATITTLLNGGGGGAAMSIQATAMAYVGMSITRKL